MTNCRAAGPARPVTTSAPRSLRRDWMPVRCSPPPGARSQSHPGRRRAPRARRGPAVARGGLHRVSPFAHALQRRWLDASTLEGTLATAIRLDARLLPFVWFVARAGGNRAGPPRAAVLVLRAGVGGAGGHVRLLRQRGRIVRDGRARCRAPRPARRDLLGVHRVRENRGDRGTVAVSARCHRRHGNARTRHDGIGTRRLAAPAERIRTATAT